MTKIFLAILLMFSAIAVVAHGMLIYQFTAVETLVTAEENTDTKTVAKAENDDSKEPFSLFFGSNKQALLQAAHPSFLNKTVACSKGFYDKPYNPPKGF